MGIQPDVIIARSDHPVPRDICDKIALFCDVDPRAVIPMETVRLDLRSAAPARRARPRRLRHRAASASTRPTARPRRLARDGRPPEAPTPPVEVAIVGKYVELHDAYLSVKESLDARRHRQRRRGRHPLGPRRGRSNAPGRGGARWRPWHHRPRRLRRTRLGRQDRARRPTRARTTSPTSASASACR